MADIDFEGNSLPTSTDGTDTNPVNQPDSTPLGGGADVTSLGTEPQPNPDNKGGEGNDDNKGTEPQQTSSTGELEQGTQIEFDGAVYTVAENGDLVDKDGNVFKEAKDVKAWLDENSVTEDDDNNDTISIDSIREAVGIDVTDDNGKPIEFTNDANGVKNYIDSVIALKSNEVATGAVNKLFNDNPMLKQFIDYVKVTGTPRGFGDIPDRSGIKLDKDNENQLEAIVRMAAEEFGNKSMNDTYIKYLKESGSLYDVAKEQLEALVGKDKAYKQEIEQKAAALRAEEEKAINDYWNSINEAISKRVIGGYRIPDSIVKEINGQKITLTPDDFYNYVAAAAEEDENGVVMTGYQRDLNNLNAEEAIAKELLDAWLMFTGGSYKDLVDMAVKEDKVRKLVIKSKEQRSARTIKVSKPTTSKVNHDDIILS